MLLPDNETFRINTMGSYNVIEAACKLGIKKIILASSITTYGVSYADGDVQYPHFPLTEDSPTQPMDVYATSKLCMERIAASFALRFPGTNIYALRIGAVIEPGRFREKFEAYQKRPREFKAHAWSYTGATDLGDMVDLCLQKDGLGFQVFNAVNDEITTREYAEEFLKHVCPETPISQNMGQREAPVSNAKMRDVLGFKEWEGWRTRF
jgi:nucleoside-diphosphate-sugar epimerase